MQMRDIKYRFWSVAGMQQVECIELDTARVRLTDGDCRDIKEGFLMQYTGLQDKNGKEIYEGDIVMIGKELIEVVKWVGDGEWMGDKQPLVGFVHHQSIYKEPVEIIGNIYENVDMLE